MLVFRIQYTIGIGNYKGKFSGQANVDIDF